MRADGIRLPLLEVGWTLNCEICFYLMVAFALLISKRRPIRTSTALLVALILLSRSLPATDLTSFYGAPIMLEFLVGFVAYRIYITLPAARCEALRPLFYVVVPLAIATMVWVQSSGHTTTPRLLYFGLPAFLTLQSVVLLSKSGMDLSWRLPVLLGDASYSLYLTHLFVISAFKRIVSARVPLLAVTRFHGLLAVLLVTSMVSIAVHLFLDRQIYRFLNGSLVPRRSTQYAIVD